MDDTKLIRKRNKLWKKFSNSPSYLLKNKYNQLKKEVSKEIKSAKVTFKERLADKIKTDPKAFYSYVRSKSKSKAKVGPLIDKNGNLFDNEEEMCQILSEYFQSVLTVEDTSDINVVV